MSRMKTLIAITSLLIGALFLPIADAEGSGQISVSTSGESGVSVSFTPLDPSCSAAGSLNLSPGGSAAAGVELTTEAGNSCNYRITASPSNPDCTVAPPEWNLAAGQAASFSTTCPEPTPEPEPTPWPTATPIPTATPPIPTPSPTPPPTPTPPDSSSTAVAPALPTVVAAAQSITDSPRSAPLVETAASAFTVCEHEVCIAFTG